MEWFYAYNGQQAGPVSEGDLGELARTGVVTPDTLVWRAGMSDWQAYRTVAPTFAPPELPHTAPSVEDYRYCNSCGNRFPASDLAMFGESAVCASCKPAYVQRLAQGMTSTTPRVFEYGGFWIRVGSAIIDSIILSVVRYAITIPLGLEGFFRPLRPGVFWAYLGTAALVGYGRADAGSISAELYCSRPGVAPGIGAAKRRVKASRALRVISD